MNSAVYEKLIKLCVNICRRNGKNKVLWLGSKEKTLAYAPKSNEMVLTAHRWFANKSCPEDWLYSRYGEFADRINTLLGTGEEQTQAANGFPATPFSVKVIIDDFNYRSEPSMGGKVKGQTGKGVFNITEVRNGWGRLKSGAEWIYLKNPEYVSVLKSASSSAPQAVPANKETKSVEEIAMEVVQVTVNRLCK